MRSMPSFSAASFALSENPSAVLMTMLNEDLPSLILVSCSTPSMSLLSRRPALELFQHAQKILAPRAADVLRPGECFERLRILPELGARVCLSLPSSRLALTNSKLAP